MFILGPAATLEILVSSVQSCEREHPCHMGNSGHDPTTFWQNAGFWGGWAISGFIQAWSQNPGVQSQLIHGQDQPLKEAAAPDSVLPKQQSNH